MSFSKTTFGIQNLFSLASRERCVKNLKRIRIPNQYMTPSPPNAAVLIPMCRVNDITSLLYTVRSADLKYHSGQIAFPGGKMNDGETPIQTALRETEEEIGLLQGKVDVWGHGPGIPGRNNKNIIAPVVGTVLDLRQEDLKINVSEVQEVFSVPIETLCDPKNQYYTQFRNGFILPVFIVDQYKIWGITAYITHAFLTCLLPKEVYRNEWMKKRIQLKDNTLETL